MTEFDFEKFQENLEVLVKKGFQDVTEQFDDIYAFTLSCSSDIDSVGTIANTVSFLEENAPQGSEDYWYFKYCEEEWDVWSGAGTECRTLSKQMKEYHEANQDTFTDAQTHNYTTAFERFRDQIADICMDVLMDFSESEEYHSHPGIALNFYIRDYFGQDEMIDIYTQLNHNETIVAEYKQHLEDFL